MELSPQNTPFIFSSFDITEKDLNVVALYQLHIWKSWANKDRSVSSALVYVNNQ